MTDQTDDAQVEADPEVQAAEAAEATAHQVVVTRRADALARLKHERDMAALAAKAEAPKPVAPAPIVTPTPEPIPEPEPQAAPQAPEPKVLAPAPEPTPEPAHAKQTEAGLSLVSEPSQPEPEPAHEAATPAPEPTPAPVEARSARPPFATGRTRPGAKVWRQGAIVSLLDHEWARVKGDLTDAEAADGEAGGARLQALVTRYGADLTWSPARPA